MTTTPATAIQPVELDWYSEDETVRVIPRDQQRFEVQKDSAIEFLRVAHRSAQFEKQLALLLGNLATWIRDHRADVRDAYLTLQDGALAFIVVRQAPRYDATFEDALTDLDFTIANDASLSLIKLNAVALPPVSEEALLSFLDTRFVLSYHGQ